MWFSSLMRNAKRSSVAERGRSHGSPGKRFAFRPQLEALEDRWMPSILTVTNAGDYIPDDIFVSPIPGSLRYEIDAAGSGDTINFAPSLMGQTITTSGNQLFIDKNLNIQGLGASNLAIRGHGSRVFDVASNVQVTLSGMTIENGDGFFTTTAELSVGSDTDGQGGGILNYGTLTLSNCSVSGNRVSTGSSQGGGIYNAGTLTVSGCTLSANAASFSGEAISGDGGGIFNVGTMTLSGCSVTNNSTTYFGGGIFNAGTMTITGCSVTSNSADYGGGVFNGGTLTILSSTVTGNSAGSGAGIYNYGNLTIASKSLVCNNFDFSGAEDDLQNFGTVKISMSKVCKFSGNK